MSFLQRAEGLIGSGRGWSGVEGDALAFVLSQVAGERGRWLVVVDGPEPAQRLVDGLEFFLRDPRRAVLLPADDCAPYDGFSPSPEVVQARMIALHRLDQRKDGILVAPVQALLRNVPDPATRQKGTRVLRVGDILDRDELVRELTATGYLAMARVNEPGAFSVRGDVVDVWPPGLRTPARIDFFDDEIEALRRVDVATQRTGRPLARLILVPAREERLDTESFAHMGRELGRLMVQQAGGPKLRRRVMEDLRDGLRFAGIEDWLPSLCPTLTPLEMVADLRTIAVSPADVRAAARDLLDTAERRWGSMDEGERPLVPPSERYGALQDVETLLERAHPVYELASTEQAVDLGARPADSMVKRGMDLDGLIAQLTELSGDGVRVGLVAGAKRLARMRELMDDRGIYVADVAHPMDLRPSEIGLVPGSLERGFLAGGSGWAMVPIQVLFGERRAKRRAAHASFRAAVSSLSQLREDDYVVHRFHGIGIYRGLSRVDSGTGAQDFVVLEYRDGDRMYLPVTHLDQVSRHAASKGNAKVRLDKLGGATWAARTGKVRDSILQMAQELLSIYARRELASREAYPPPAEMSLRFENDFPWDETPDQAAAIDAVHADLGKKVPMDRLLCGDVGFGKTEVAMRAAMRVVEAGKQVMVLCPTTVLAFQHFRTFKERFADYGVTVRMLSRFVSAANQATVKQELREGKADIVVGTTALLGRGVKFGRLGLVIIDEEHRFGVRQKDRLKKMRANIDVLAMSATPIPRTLEMGLIGMREMSVMATPPRQRLEVRTSVARMTRTRVRDALMREHDRGGQSFFVHNRIEDIDEVAAQIREWVPELSVVVAHGQMVESELEDRLVSFIEGRHDVLLSTAIIESGIDLPNVNTMLVNRADRFGLAQLYQLRGRVGRGDVRATCLLLVPEELRGDARKRIRVLVDHVRLGSGFQVASADLELRGAGNLLGESQSGNIDAVGYEMWLELLAEAVSVARGEMDRERIDPEIEVPAPTFIPQSMAPEVEERMALYGRFARCQVPAEVDRLLDELEADHGDLPLEVRNLAELTQVKLTCRELAISRCSWLKVRAVLELHPSSPIPAARIDRLLRVHPRRFKRVNKGGTTLLDVRFLPEEGERPFRFLRWVLAQLSRD